MKTPAALHLATAGFLCAVLSGCGLVSPDAVSAERTPLATSATSTESSAPARPAGTSRTAAAARSALNRLPVKGKAPKTGYQRTAQFGRAWLDVDHNGCDTRNDILARDLTGIVRSGQCKITAGTLNDAYTGEIIHFVRGERTSRAVQIDHVVAMQNAWQTGAQQLTQELREEFANDPANLRAVDGAANQQKGAGDTATWLPPNRGFRCQYVEAQITVKAKYRLWVTSAEKAAMQRVLARC